MIYGLHIDSTPETIMSNINKYNKLKIIQLFVSLGKTKRKYYDEIIQKYKIIYFIKLLNLEINFDLFIFKCVL